MSLIRFFINFVLFGALFYLIWHYFPDAFATLVSWVKTIIDFTEQLLTDLYNKISTNSLNKKDIEPIKTLAHLIYNSIR